MLEICDHGSTPFTIWRIVPGSREGAKPRSPYERRTILALSTVRANIDRQMAFIFQGDDCNVGMVGKTCIGMPTRLIYSRKGWIDKSGYNEVYINESC